MYRELTQQQRTARTRTRLVIALCAIVLICCACFASNAINANLREQGAVSVRNAILESAKQCCAIEGAYPTSLAYLEQNYGLSINQDDYVITYEVFAENVMPGVVVLPK